MGGSGGFFGALFGGKDVNLNNLIGQYGQIGGQQTGTGQKYENQAGDFFSSILSGDAGRISQALAPEISAAKTSNQQTQKSNAEMGTRSGGTAASNNASSDKLHSDITKMIGSLTGGAASSLASLGSSEMSTGSRVRARAGRRHSRECRTGATASWVAESQQRFLRQKHTHLAVKTGESHGKR